MRKILNKLINIWIAIVDDCILQSFFKPGNLTEEKVMYLRLLQNYVDAYRSYSKSQSPLYYEGVKVSIKLCVPAFK